jgi:hypothetical protein
MRQTSTRFTRHPKVGRRLKNFPAAKLFDSLVLCFKAIPNLIPGGSAYFPRGSRNRDSGDILMNGTHTNHWQDPLCLEKYIRGRCPMSRPYYLTTYSYQEGPHLPNSASSERAVILTSYGASAIVHADMGGFSLGNI